MVNRSYLCTVITVSVILFLTVVLMPTLPAEGHLYGYNVQEWNNTKDNIRIQFIADPFTPTAGKNSTLLFSVQNLQTGLHIANFTEKISVTKTGNSVSSLTQNFESREIATGDFSQKIVFPSGGVYEILLRVDTPTLIDVAKFTVFVSTPQFQLLNLVYLLLPVIIFISLLGTAIIFIARRIYKKK